MPAILAFFATTLGKYVAAFGVATFLFSTAVFLYIQHDKRVAAEALAEFNKKQYEQVIADNAKLTKALADLQIEADKITSDLEKAETDRSKLSVDIEKLIAASPDRPASQVLKDTIKALQRGKI